MPSVPNFQCSVPICDACQFVFNFLWFSGVQSLALSGPEVYFSSFDLGTRYILKQIVL